MSTGWPVAIEADLDRRPSFERVVLVTIDTLRADHVSSYGYPRQTTPFIDSLAARGVRFERAMAAVSHTAPSHATMMTGVVPAVHGLLRNGQTLDSSAVDLAELFREADATSAAFLNAKFLLGVATSFDLVEVRGAAHGGERVVSAALDWLRSGRESERFLLWVHLYDPHEWQRLLADKSSASPWSGFTPEGFLETVLELHGLPATQPGQPYEIDWGLDRAPGERIQGTDAAAFLACIDRYDAQTLLADRQVQRLYEGLEGLGLAGNTLWVLTSDHGEGLASHAVTGHGQRIYQEQLHVPLLFHASDGSLGPRVATELVAHTDLLPTLAEAVGFRVSGSAPFYEGRSLWPLLRGESEDWRTRSVFSQRRPVYQAHEEDRAEVFALQTSSLKLIRHIPGLEELYDLVLDPKERVDLGADHPGAGELRLALDERLRLIRGKSPASAHGDIPPQWLQELKDLGY